MSVELCACEGCRPAAAAGKQGEAEREVVGQGEEGLGEVDAPPKPMVAVVLRREELVLAPDLDRSLNCPGGACPT